MARGGLSENRSDVWTFSLPVVIRDARPFHDASRDAAQEAMRSIEDLSLSALLANWVVMRSRV